MHFLFRCSPNPDITQVDKLLHGNENVVCADAGYTGVEKRPEHAGREVIWQVAIRMGLVTEDQATEAISVQFGLPVVTLEETHMPP